MLKFVLLFIAVTIAGTEEDCSTSTRWNLCFGIMKALLEVKDNQQQTCSLATKAAGCFEQSSCIPEKDWNYIIGVLAGCGDQQICPYSGWRLCIHIVDVIMLDLRVKVLQSNEGKEIMCSLAKMAKKCFNQARCTQRSDVLGIVAGCDSKETDCDVTKALKCRDRTKKYYDICSEHLFEQLNYCYPSSECDALYEMEDIYLKRVCVNSKETDCDVTKAFECRDRIKNYSDICSELVFEQIKYCYPSNECDAFYEMEEIYLKRVCEKCKREDSKVCFEVMDNVIQINQSKSFACSLAELAVSCFKAAGCPPMQNAVDIVAGCEAKDCDVHNVYKCRDTMDKYLDVCNEEHLEQIKPCYTNNNCNALFESIAMSLKKLCSQKKTVKQ